MPANCHGRCRTCDVIWCWPGGKHALRVTKGEAFCQVCGQELDRTAARLAKSIPIRDGQPVGSIAAGKLRRCLAQKFKRADPPASS